MPTNRRVTPLGYWHPAVLIVVWSVPVILGIPYILVSMSASGLAAPAWRAVLVGVACWQSWVVITVLVVRLTDRVPVQRPLRGALVVHVGAALAALVAQAAATTLAIELLLPGEASALEVFVWWFMLLAPAGVVVYAAVVAVRTAQRNGSEARERAGQARELSRQLAESQLLALRSQLRPHFLFNTLTAVLALVRDGDTQGAARGIEALSALLRHTLHGDARHEVTLDEELRFIDDYLRIEKLRQGERLRVRFDVPPDLRAVRVPSLVLQPLVENALKHGMARNREPMDLSIVAAAPNGSLLLRVTDTGQGLAAASRVSVQSGVGLSNLRDRLERLYPGEGHLAVHTSSAGRGVTAEVSIPLRAP